MKIWILSIFDKTSYGTDERVVIQAVYQTEEAAEKAAQDLALESFEDFLIEEFEVLP